MPLPTAEPEQTREAKNRDFNNLDSLISELNQEKEQIQSSQYNQEPETSNQQPETGNPESEPWNMESENEHEPISEDVAAMSGKSIAGTIDTVAGTGFSLYAKSDDPEKYQASPRQLDQLNNAWSAVAKKYGYKVEDSPWFNVMMLNMAVYLPKWQTALNDRRFALMENRMDELSKQVKDLENQKNEKEKTK